jgi:hypothetical protein
MRLRTCVCNKISIRYSAIKQTPKRTLERQKTSGILHYGYDQVNCLHEQKYEGYTAEGIRWHVAQIELSEREALLFLV